MLARNSDFRRDASSAPSLAIFSARSCSTSSRLTWVSSRYVLSSCAFCSPAWIYSLAFSIAVPMNEHSSFMKSMSACVSVTIWRTLSSVSTPINVRLQQIGILSKVSIGVPRASSWSRIPLVVLRHRQMDDLSRIHDIDRQVAGSAGRNRAFVAAQPDPPERAIIVFGNPKDRLEFRRADSKTLLPQILALDHAEKRQIETVVAQKLVGDHLEDLLGRGQVVEFGNEFQKPGALAGGIFDRPHLVGEPAMRSTVDNLRGKSLDDCADRIDAVFAEIARAAQRHHDADRAAFMAKRRNQHRLQLPALESDARIFMRGGHALQIDDGGLAFAESLRDFVIILELHGKFAISAADICQLFRENDQVVAQLLPRLDP